MKTLITRFGFLAALAMLVFVAPLRAQDATEEPKQDVETAVEEADQAIDQASEAIDEAQEAIAEGTIVDVARENGNFTTLLAALEAAGLTETLQGDGPFTVFAPTDEAFAALPEGTLEELLKPENHDQLVSILQYHVIDGQSSASDAADLSTATSLQGGDLTITTMDDAIMVNEAHVVQPDVQASNGVIHVIDTVLLPPADDAMEEGAVEEGTIEESPEGTVEEGTVEDNTEGTIEEGTTDTDEVAPAPNDGTVVPNDGTVEDDTEGTVEPSPDGTVEEGAVEEGTTEETPEEVQPGPAPNN